MSLKECYDKMGADYEDVLSRLNMPAWNKHQAMPENTKNPSACTTMIKLIKIPHNFRSFILSSPPYIQVHGLL